MFDCIAYFRVAVAQHPASNTDPDPPRGAPVHPAQAPGPHPRADDHVTYIPIHPAHCLHTGECATHLGI